MTPEKLKELIENNQSLLDLVDAGNDHACAEKINKDFPQYAYRSTMITERGILSAFADPNDGDKVLKAIETYATSNGVAKRILKLLEPTNGGVDIGDPRTWAFLDSMVTTFKITAAQAQSLKDVAKYQVIVTSEDVANAFGRGR